MGSNYIYLVPGKSGVSAKEYGAKVREALLEMKVIAIGELDDPGNFGNGDESAKAFEGEEDADELPFEFGTIFDGPHFTFLPEAYEYGITCPRCGNDLVEEFYKATVDEENNWRENEDLRGVRITCQKCNGVYALDELKGEYHEFCLTDRYVCFVGARLPKARWLEEFDRRTGQQHRVLEYGFS